MTPQLLLPVQNNDLNEKYYKNIFAGLQLWAHKIFVKWDPAP